MNRGKLIVVSGPSGSGKDTVLGKALGVLGDSAYLSVSMTTRKKRRNEIDSIDYYFVSEQEFLSHVESGDMLEYAKYGSNYYGTPAGPIKSLVDSGNIVFLNIDVQGGANVRRIFPDAVKVFVLPPSVGELERRLRSRGTEDEQSIKVRMEIALTEIRRANEYDYVLINDDLCETVDGLLSIVRSQRPKTENINELIRKVLSDV